jgi:hypothetical protein
MSELRADDDVGISSVRRMGVGDLVTARAPDRVNRSLKLPRFRGVMLDLGDYGSVVTASIAG